MGARPIKDAARENGVCVITGGASGIGLALARRCVQLGFRVCVLDLARPDAMAAAEASLSALAPYSSAATSPASLPRVLTVRADVSDLEQVEASLKAMQAAWGPEVLISALFNNAGIQYGKSCFLEGKQGVAQWRKALEINTMGVVHCNHVFVPYMHAQSKPGIVVATSSVSGLFNTFRETGAPYNVSKFGATMVAECLQLELRALKSQVRSYLLCPGIIKTQFVENSISISSSSSSSSSRESSKGNDELIQNFKAIPPSYFMDVDEMVARFVADLEDNPTSFYKLISSDGLQPRELLNAIILDRTRDITEQRPVVSRLLKGSRRQDFKKTTKHAFQLAKMRLAKL
jgi:NAD(P)-dependent dehydrogenase (short-subunit alcohol dehydrogenase family)